MYRGRQYLNGKEKVQATVFSFFLFTCFCVSIFVAFDSSGPIILGTEMNTNGAVEYMCLGNGCEGLNSFKWSDK